MSLIIDQQSGWNRPPSTQATKSHLDGRKAMKLPEIDAIAGQLSEQPRKRNSARLLILEWPFH